MAIPERSMPQGAHVKLVGPEARERLRAVPHDEGPPAAPIPLPGRTVVVRLDDARTDEWFSDELRVRAEQLLDALEVAADRGHRRREARLVTALLGVVHADRLARAKALATHHGLRMDPTGRGPVFHRPAVHLRDRLPWHIVPIDRHTRLGERAAAVKDAWESEGAIFDTYYLVDEPAGASPVPCHSLIGVLSADGATGDWFVLDRWGS